MIAILTVSVAMFAQTISASARLDPVANETMLAAEGARLKLEDMKSEDLVELFARYNSDPTDDPAGPGTAPGNTFTIEGLSPATVGGVVGRIDFPVIGTQLREDVTDTGLGMPRDLDGDGTVDAGDHANDYIVLPIRVRVEWASKCGKGGKRWMETFAMFSPL